MRVSPLAAIIAACVLSLTACGDDGGDGSSADKSPSASPSHAGKDKSESAGEAPKGDDPVCARVDAKDVEKIVGIRVKKGDVEGSTCNFRAPRDAASGSVTINETSLTELGGVGGVKRSITLLGDLEVEKVSDVGDQAFVGVEAGSSDLAIAAGAVIVGESVVMASVATDQRLSADEVKEQTVALLELGVERL
jgi:hypothetical protein